MFKRIFEAGIINLLNSALSFIITLIIVQQSGVDKVGEIYFLLASLSVILLVNIFFPPAYSIVKIQESQVFIKYFFSMYFYSQFIIVLIVMLFFYNKYNIWTISIILYCIASSWVSFYDVLLQSKGMIKNFYSAVLFGSVIKVCLLVLFIRTDTLIMELLMYLVFGQIASLIIMMYMNSKKGRQIVFNTSLAGLYGFYRSNFLNIKGFYLSSIFKRLFDNLPALAFGTILTSTAMGVFSIFQKCLVFGVSFIRIIESLLLSKEYSAQINLKMKVFIAVLSIILTFIASLVYSFLTIGVMLEYCLLMSFLVIPVFITIEIRAKYIKMYNMFHVNVAMVLSMLAMYSFSKLFLLGESQSIFISYSVMLLVQALWLTLTLIIKRKE